MTEFTKGPWKWVEDRGSHRLVDKDYNGVLLPTFVRITCLPGQYPDTGDFADVYASDPDRYLIAASPDLYRALQDIVIVFYSEMTRNAGQPFTGQWVSPGMSESMTCNEVLGKAKWALEKARGQ